MKKISVSALLLVLQALLLTGCSEIQFSEAKTASEDYMENIRENNWDLLWAKSSYTYQKKSNIYNMFRLRDWINQELGPIESYEQTYCYQGSKLGFRDNEYVRTHYIVHSDRGKGEISITLVKENNEFKIQSLEVIKKPNF